MATGVFITIEGPDGAGKSTIQADVGAILREEGFPIILTREPGGIEIAEKIRHIILDKENIAMDARTESLLYAAARRQHLAEKVIPAIADGKVVLCDRFVDSSLAYQGYGRNLGVDEVFQINQFAIQNTMPNLTLFLMIEPEEGLLRINKNKGREVNRLDLEDITFHKKVFEGYQLLAQRYNDRIKVIDASRTYQEVLMETVTTIRDFLIEKEIVNA